MTSKNDIPVKS